MKKTTISIIHITVKVCMLRCVIMYPNGVAKEKRFVIKITVRLPLMI